MLAMPILVYISLIKRFTLNVNKKMLPLNQLVSGGELENDHMSLNEIALGVVMVCKAFIVHLLWSSQRIQLRMTSQPADNLPFRQFSVMNVLFVHLLLKASS